MVNCDTQEEIDHYWEKLSEEGDPKAQECGWLKDKFGLSWQIVPKQLAEMLIKDDHQAVERTFGAMMKMKKLNIHELEAAFKGQ